MNIGIPVLVLLFVAQAGFAQDYRTSGKTAATRHAATLKSLERGKAVKGSREQYQYLPQVFAVALANSSETPEQAIARIGESGAQFVETKGRLVLYRAGTTNAALIKRVGGATVYPTVVNTRTGTLGVLTGTLIVKPKNMADADAIAGSYGLEKTKVYPQLETVFYRTKAGVDIADVSAALQADPRVDNAYPEIVERLRVPK
jgi:uncharacterized protein